MTILLSNNYSQIFKNKVEHIFISSDKVFKQFVIKYDINLDNEYNDIINISNEYINETVNNNCDKLKYLPYFNLFTDNKLKDDINFIYYILIFYYITLEQLINFTRFVSVKLFYYKLITIENHLPLNDLQKMDKISLLKHLKDLIKYDSINMLFLIMMIQMYF